MDYFSISYDVLNAAISIADLITDILVTYKFSADGRQFFFIASCCVIAWTHICYAICFAVRFTSYNYRCKRILVFICVIPITPFLPFIFYWASFPSSSFSRFIVWLGLQSDEVATTDYINSNINAQPLLQNQPNPSSYESISDYNKMVKKENRKQKYKRMNAWFQTRILFNSGFLIEGLVQSFPMAILQCVAMMHYGENDNYLAVTSIVLSLLSIAVKSIVMFLNSYCTLMIVHKWMSTLRDFLGMFVTISLAFARIDGIQNNDYCIWLCEYIQIDGVSWLGYFWFYKVIFITFPLVFLMVLGLILFYVHSFWEENNCLRVSFLWQCCAFFPSLLLFALLWIPGSVAVVFGVVGMEVCFYCWSIMLFYQINHDRFPSDWKYPDTWNLIFKFLLNTDENDQEFQLLLEKYNQSCYEIQFLKMYSINMVLSRTKVYYQERRNDEQLYEYLNKNESIVFGCHRDKSNHKITLNDFYRNSFKYNSTEPTLMRYFLNEMCSIYPELYERMGLHSGANHNIHFYLVVPAFFIFSAVVWFFAPLYAFVNRPLTFIYPYIALLWLLFADYSNDVWFGFDFNQNMHISNITTFQYCIVSVFILFDLICLVLTIKLCVFERLMTFILPGHDYINIYSRRNANNSVYDEVADYYDFHKNNVLTNQFLLETYGDIGYVIIMYLPQSFHDLSLCQDLPFYYKSPEPIKAPKSPSYIAL